jgi:hypothetical protein
MKNFKIIKYFSAILILLVTSVSFAQPGFDSTGGTDVVDNQAPIDNYLWVLILVGLVYVFYKYRKLRSYNGL